MWINLYKIKFIHYYINIFPRFFIIIILKDESDNKNLKKEFRFLINKKFFTLIFI